MAKIFLSYKFTGEDPKELEKVLGKLKACLEAKGHTLFCSFLFEQFFRDKGYTVDEIYDYCLNQLTSCDVFIAFVKSKEPSKGMELESEKAAVLKKPYILAIKKGLEFSEFRKVADTIIEFDTIDGLCNQLSMASASR